MAGRLFRSAGGGILASGRAPDDFSIRPLKEDTYLHVPNDEKAVIQVGGEFPRIRNHNIPSVFGVAECSPAKQTGFQLRLLVPGNYGDEIQTMLSARHQEAMEPPSEFNLLSGFGPFGKPKLNPEQVAQLRQRAQAG